MRKYSEHKPEYALILKREKCAVCTQQQKEFDPRLKNAENKISVKWNKKKIHIVNIHMENVWYSIFQWTHKAFALISNRNFLWIEVVSTGKNSFESRGNKKFKRKCHGNSVIFCAPWNSFNETEAWMRPTEFNQTWKTKHRFELMSNWLLERKFTFYSGIPDLVAQWSVEFNRKSTSVWIVVQMKSIECSLISQIDRSSERKWKFRCFSVRIFLLLLFGCRALSSCVVFH